MGACRPWREAMPMDSDKLLHIKADLFDLLRQMELLEHRKRELLRELEQLECQRASQGPQPQGPSQ